MDTQCLLDLLEAERSECKEYEKLRMEVDLTMGNEAKGFSEKKRELNAMADMLGDTRKQIVEWFDKYR